MWWAGDLENRGKGVCPAGGKHQQGGSADYTLNNTDGGAGEDRFSFCRKCNGMWDADFGDCTTGGSHNFEGSGDYGLSWNESSEPSGQPGWRACKRCSCVFYGAGDPSRCVYGGTHVADVTINYTVPWDANATGQQGWRRCWKCQGLFYGPEITATKCAADGGKHAMDSSAFYNLPAFSLDTTYLVGEGLGAGEVWQDAERNIKVRVVQISSETFSAAIEMGPISESSPTSLGMVGGPDRDEIATFPTPAPMERISFVDADLKAPTRPQALLDLTRMRPEE
jgi:hypothetical protein